MRRRRTPRQAPATAPSPAPEPAARDGDAPPPPQTSNSTTQPGLDLSNLLFPATQPQAAAAALPKREAIPRPPARLDIPPVEGVTDAQIGASITKGIDYLLKRFSGPVISGNYGITRDSIRWRSTL